MGVPVVVIIVILAIAIVAIVIGVLVIKKKDTYKKQRDDTAVSIKDLMEKEDGSITGKM